MAVGAASAAVRIANESACLRYAYPCDSLIKRKLRHRQAGFSLAAVAGNAWNVDRAWNSVGRLERKKQAFRGGWLWENGSVIFQMVVLCYTGCALFGDMRISGWLGACEMLRKRLSFFDSICDVHAKKFNWLINNRTCNFLSWVQINKLLFIL